MTLNKNLLVSVFSFSSCFLSKKGYLRASIYIQYCMDTAWTVVTVCQTLRPMATCAMAALNRKGNQISFSVFSRNMRLFSNTLRYSDSGKSTPRVVLSMTIDSAQGVTKRCPWLTNSALVYESKAGGGGSCGASANEYSCTQEPK
jgi:hypothetical protein